PRLIIFKPGTASCNPTAPVGFGPDLTRPPSQAQAPTARQAAALPQTSVAISSAVRPAIVQYTPSSAVGIAPSTITRYLPFCSSTTRLSTASACLPEPAIIVSWYSQERSSRTTSSTGG